MTTSSGWFLSQASFSFASVAHANSAVLLRATRSPCSFSCKGISCGHTPVFGPICRMQLWSKCSVGIGVEPQWLTLADLEFLFFNISARILLCTLHRRLGGKSCNFCYILEVLKSHFYLVRVLIIVFPSWKGT